MQTRLSCCDLRLPLPSFLAQLSSGFMRVNFPIALDGDLGRQHTTTAHAVPSNPSQSEVGLQMMRWTHIGSTLAFRSIMACPSTSLRQVNESTF